MTEEYTPFAASAPSSNGPTWAQVTADPSALDLTLLDYAVGGATANNANIAGFTVSRGVRCGPGRPTAFFLPTMLPS